MQLPLCDHQVIVKFKGFSPLRGGEYSQFPYFWRLVKAFPGSDPIYNLR